MERKFTELDNLKINQEKWYKALPKTGVDFAIAIELGKKFKISRNTINRRLQNEKLFIKSGKRYIPIIQ